MKNYLLLSFTILSALFLPSAIANNIQIHVLSAVVKDQKIAAADITLQKNGAASTSGKTNADGTAQLVSAFSDADDALLIIKKEGFSNLVVKCPCNGMTYAISPVMTKLDGLRIVLNWGATPDDLDSHIIFPNSHVFFDQKSAKDANLDVDDINSYGPETITIEQKHFGETYSYAVMNFSELNKSATETLSRSNAKVFVYIGQTLIKTYYVPKSTIGNYWKVFSIDGAGEFHDINTMGDIFYSSTEDIKKHFPDEIRADVAENMGPTSNATRADAPAESSARPLQPTTADAKHINQQGETAYHEKRLDDAADLFRQAIELSPDFGQAYSNLGLVYLKTGRIAESIWANRKAIALASGDKANVVRASSYFNIASIYESAGDFASALAQYNLADQQRPMPVYKTAIARMQQKLGQ